MQWADTLENWTVLFTREENCILLCIRLVCWCSLPHTENSDYTTVRQQIPDMTCIKRNNWSHASVTDCKWHLVKDIRWALCDESNEEVHVVNEGVVIRAGQVFGLMLVSSCSIIVHIDDTILHTSNISQILWQVLTIKGIFPILRRMCEDCRIGAFVIMWN